MNRLLLSYVFCLMASAFLAGCHHGQELEGKTATDIDPKLADPNTYWDKPGVIHVPARDFDRLWLACQASARQYFFKIDRLDYREGVITTEPTVTAQFYEPWRQDNTTLHDVALSSIAKYRRTMRFDITRNDDGTFEVTPKVLIEREAFQTKRITAVVKYYESFYSGDAHQYGSREADEGAAIPIQYWYATARDYNLERRLAQDVLDHLY
jgi:hypothetical protein